MDRKERVKEPCPLCGSAAYLTRCAVYVSLWSPGAVKRICDSCIDVLRERHIHVTVDEDELAEANHAG